MRNEELRETLRVFDSYRIEQKRFIPVYQSGVGTAHHPFLTPNFYFLIETASKPQG